MCTNCLKPRSKQACLVLKQQVGRSGCPPLGFLKEGAPLLAGHASVLPAYWHSPRVLLLEVCKAVGNVIPIFHPLTLVSEGGGAAMAAAAQAAAAAAAR